MKIAIGCDHIVTETKDYVKEYLEKKGHEVLDMGTYDKERTHYPIFGKKVAEKVVTKEADFGIVICGTGVGITVSALKVKGTRGALVRDIATARHIRKNYDANILGMGGRITGLGLMENIVDVFLDTPYEKSEEGDRFIEEIDKMGKALEEGSEKIFDDLLRKWDSGEYSD